MITKNSEIHNADRLIYAIIKCAVDDYKTELRLQGKGLYVNSSTESFFKSEYFDYLISHTELNGVRGEDIVEALKEKEAKRKAKKKF